MINKQEVALRVNELFHDIEGKEYQKKHTDIFTGEVTRWRNAAEKYFSDYQSPINILDIGTGTGFVPLTLANYLNKNDWFICSDISTEMLNIAKENIENKNFNCKFSFHKTDGNKINTENISIVTMNSVLHHIPDLENFFSQINRIVMPGGRVIIGHEPNKFFYQNKFLVNLYLFFSLFSSVKNFILNILRFFGLTYLLKKVFPRFVKPSHKTIEINIRLKKENFITEDLTEDEINQLIDYHSPSSGSVIDKTKGIDIEELRKTYLSDFETEYFETYNFISKMSVKNWLMKRINNCLSKKYKEYGATFFVVLKKEK